MDARTSAYLVPAATRAASPPARGHRAVRGAYEIELCSAAEAQGAVDAWRSLAARALEPNIFAGPDFLLPALQHLPEGRAATLMLIWQPVAGSRLLQGLLPLVMPRLRFVPGEVRLWQPPFVPTSPMLIDRAQAEAVIAAALSDLAARGSRCSGLMMRGLSRTGATATALWSVAARTGRRLEYFPSPRPGAAPASDPREPAAGAMGAIEHARGAGAVRDAVETFLRLDAASAAAEGRRALIEDPGAASFIRTATRQLARRRQCRLETVHVEGEAAAAMIVLETAGTLHPWRVAALPGHRVPIDRLLASAVARARRSGKALSAGEAGSIDCLVSIRPGRSPSGTAVQWKEQWDRRLRAVAGGGQRFLRTRAA